MPIRDTPLSFDCEGESLFGILTLPEAPARTGVVVVVGGPQYRVGSHRQFVLLARRLGAAGLPCLRFDYRGMGDSDGAPRSFASIDADITVAIDALQRAAGVESVVLWGLCDGASAALLYAPSDPRVTGIIAINPWAKTAAVQASVRLRHYYLRRILSTEFWRKLLGGKVRLVASASDAMSSVRDALAGASPDSDYLARMHAGLVDTRRRLLVVLSGNDLTAREFEAWVAVDSMRRSFAESPGAEVHRIEAADHTFSDAASRQRLEDKTLEWIARICSPSAADPLPLAGGR